MAPQQQQSNQIECRRALEAAIIQLHTMFFTCICPEDGASSAAPADNLPHEPNQLSIVLWHALGRAVKFITRQSTGAYKARSMSRCHIYQLVTRPSRNPCTLAMRPGALPCSGFVLHRMASCNIFKLSVFFAAASFSSTSSSSSSRRRLYLIESAACLIM